MGAMRLHEIRETARTSDAGDGGDLLVPQLALFDQLEVKRQHREVAATGTPRGMIGGEFLFCQPLALGVGERRNRGDVVARRDFDGWGTHSFIESLVR